MRSLICVLLCVLARPVAAGPPADPSGLTRARLDCGLEVWVYPLPGCDEVGVGLVIRAGSIDEQAGQAGAAYLAKRTAGFGTPGVPWETLATFGGRFGARGERGLDPRAGEHGRLMPDSVSFLLVCERGDFEAMSAALLHTRDLVSGWVPSDSQIEAARLVSRNPSPIGGVAFRARELYMPEIFAGEPLGERALIPTGEGLEAITPDAVRGYIADRYRPGNAVLILMGGVDPGGALSAARRAFEGVPARGALPGQPGMTGGGIGGRVSAHTIEGYKSREIALVAARAVGAEPADPVGEQTLDMTAAELVAARVGRAVALAEPDVEKVESYSGVLVRGAVLSEVSVSLARGDHAAAGRAAMVELARIRADGFEPSEFPAARAAVLAKIEAGVRDWQASDAARVWGVLAWSAARGHGFVEPADKLAHASRVLAQTTDAALGERAQRLFDVDAMACILLGPAGAEGVDEAAARAVLSAPDGLPSQARAVWEPPLAAGAGSLVEVSVDVPTGVWSGVLANGVVARARGMDAADRVIVRIVFNAGVTDEDARTLGRTRDAAAAWRYPKIGDAGAREIRAWTLSRGLEFRAEVHEQRLALQITGPAGSERDALALAAALAGDPGVDPAFVGRAVGRDRDFGPGVEMLWRRLVGEKDPRSVVPPPNDSIDAGEATAWLRAVCAAPAEVAIVGPGEAGAMLDAAAATLGVLPARERPSRGWAKSWGALPGGEDTATVVGAAGESLLAVVFGDANDLATARAMLVASELVDRVLRRLADEQPDVAESRAWLWLGDGVPGRASLCARVVFEPGSDGDGGSLIDRAIEAVLSDLPDGTIREQIERTRRQVDRVWERPEFWADRLSTLAGNGLGIDSISGQPAAYDALTPAAVREALARAMGAGVHKRVTVIGDH
ncbi:MAG: insulinase family protein [Planctomycetota bacterium]|nr:MAG: insulinase family protein [Planctomycetota bacterium]